MSNISTPRHTVGTVKSLLVGYFNPDYKPTPNDVQRAIADKKAHAKRPLNIHRDGRLFVPYQRMTSPQKKIGKGNGKRV